MIVFIHGANATSKSWSYILSKINVRNISVDYDSSLGFRRNLISIRSQIPTDEPIQIVGHSLGGIYGLYLTQTHNVTKGLTLATPYAGVAVADFMKMIFPGSHLLKDIGKYSRFITKSRNIKIKVPWTQIITTRGSLPWYLERNDGIVPISSMTCRNDINYLELPYNHYEILYSDEVVNLITC
jgi:pimeloyl-ACP methyl ester carboxylesterase